MKIQSWLDQLKTAEKNVSDNGSLRTVVYSLKNGDLLKEEYNTELDIVTRRAWKNNGMFNNEWDDQLGEPEVCDDFSIKENSSQPYVRKKNTKRRLEWRIRNLKHPKENYSVACEDGDDKIVVKSINKSYFKLLRIPELERIGMKLVRKNLSYNFQFNDLVIIVSMK